MTKTELESKTIDELYDILTELRGNKIVWFNSSLKEKLIELILALS